MLSENTIKIVKSTAPILADRGVEITTYFYEKLFEAHPALLNIFNHANQKKGRQQTALANTVYAAATYIDQLEVLIPAVKQIAHKHRSLGVKEEHYPIVGEFLLKAIKDVLGDAATPEIINAWAEAYGVIAQVFIDVEKEMYNEAKAQAWEGFKAFKVVNKIKESSVITSFYLQPADGSSTPTFKPGQYVTVRLKVEGEEYLLNRQYSLSDAPGENHLRISVKKEGEEPSSLGKVSNYLHEHVNEGDEVEITAPAGDFVLNETDNTPVYLISGGVGITPMMSMLKRIADQQPDRHVTFIHAAKNGALQAFQEEVTETVNSLSNAKKVIVFQNPTPSDRENRKFDEEGYVDFNKLQTIVEEKEASFYVCGPVAFMKNTIENLEKLGVKEENIHFEFFGPSINLKADQTA
ncbi:NO-inducible flavohemoprotein [Metabacillus sediminilitoris]|uniref:Flavohemoprotein n=1 Tax=Metabacillus sediminilitoris TaxID=2567941 RepID=A0A4S4BXW7_9BACI|nr:NO-inducible flavohemoprotein [Metabacillus sediminilitoris]QGQ44433.1 NO-inducible flavohemoprotein [Metabacillus sediminilitoris]THF80056.1 NO-inducible flavohemoprotein [Metabacillus sediminilitoris]